MNADRESIFIWKIYCRNLIILRKVMTYVSQSLKPSREEEFDTHLLLTNLESFLWCPLTGFYCDESIHSLSEHRDFCSVNNNNMREKELFNNCDVYIISNVDKGFILKNQCVLFKHTEYCYNIVSRNTKLSENWLEISRDYWKVFTSHWINKFHLKQNLEPYFLVL